MATDPRPSAARDSLRPREGEALTTGPSSRLDSPESEASGHVAGGRRVKGRARGAAPVGSAATRLRQLVEESQGGGYTSWFDQYGKEVVGLDTHQCLVDDHTEMGRLVLDLLEGEE